MRIPEQARSQITFRASQLGDSVSDLVSNLLCDKHNFLDCSGSDAIHKHHYGTGGLVVHTEEVIELGYGCNDILELNIDKTEWFCAALFHDVGKMFDYKKVAGSKYDDWAPTDHKRLVHHLCRSAIYWSHAVEKFPDLRDKYHDSLLHAILAHHGQREWGSPVAPKTKVAWLLHKCDGISARMNDCDKMDFLKFKQHNPS